jgi:subtilase family serine protease
MVNGTNPGDIGADEDTEADLDVEWSGAIAPGASIQFVTSSSTESTDGTELSAEYIVDTMVPTPPDPQFELWRM